MNDYDDVEEKKHTINVFMITNLLLVKTNFIVILSRIARYPRWEIFKQNLDDTVLYLFYIILT